MLDELGYQLETFLLRHSNDFCGMRGDIQRLRPAGQIILSMQDAQLPLRHQVQFVRAYGKQVASRWPHVLSPFCTLQELRACENATNYNIINT